MFNQVFNTIGRRLNPPTQKIFPGAKSLEETLSRHSNDVLRVHLANGKSFIASPRSFFDPDEKLLKSRAFANGSPKSYQKRADSFAEGSNYRSSVDRINSYNNRKVTDVTYHFRLPNDNKMMSISPDSISKVEVITDLTRS